jgi:UDP-N-acetylmuramoyl-L-alanyl-D-glutamate--2,6-diaminopimelate ligase
MAAAACAGADAVVLTSDNPRTEDPQAILRDALAGVPDADRGRVAVDADRRAAIGMIIADARPGDVVVIAGKGHENYQLLPDGKGGIIRRDFDDRAVAAEALASR